MSELLDRIKSCGGTVHVENSDLVIRSPNGLPPELREEARDRKAEIIQALQCRVELTLPPLGGGGHCDQGHGAEEALQTQSGEPVTSCPACNRGCWCQENPGKWWYERCQSFGPGQWQQRVTLPKDERLAPPPLTDEQIEAAMPAADQDGRDEGALATAFGSDWPGVTAEVQALEEGLPDLVSRSSPSGAHCHQCGSQIAIPESPEDPAYCTNCDALFAGPAVPIGREPEPNQNCRMCGRSEFRPDRWGVPRCRSCRPYLPGVDDG